VLFTKLAEYLGENIKYLVDRPDEPYLFRLVGCRVYYMSARIARLAGSIGKDQFLESGVLFGKFTKGGKFRLNITALDYLGKYAQHRVWLKDSGEMPFLYGNHILKHHVARMSEAIPQYAGVVIFNLKDMPIGFGASSRTVQQLKDSEPTAVVFFNQADIGEYLRTEGE
jgi:60S ribosome subunit biogenesis protein NIP7